MSILADRYASTAMKDIWSPESKILAERNLWITVMKTQAKLGFDIPAQAIADYEKVKTQIDLASIDKRERELRHDVKARIEEFNALAGHQYIHIAMTSRDLTENIEALQIRHSLDLVMDRSYVLLETLTNTAKRYAKVPLVGRTHNIPAQVTSLGRRFASWAEELLFAIENIENLLTRLPIRGIKGAIGTESDLKYMMQDKEDVFQKAIGEYLESNNILVAPSQIYSRSIDFEVLSSLVELSAAPSNIALNIRLMSGSGLLAEDFISGQSGSSAMPHKINPRLSERINALAIILKGFLSMITGISGEQWNEGDVSCSAVRRVAIPGAFMTIDGILNTCISVLKKLVVFEEELDREVKTFLPELSSTTILMELVKNGMGRELAHSLLKEHAIRGLEDRRLYGENTFFARIIADEDLSIDEEIIKNLVSTPFLLSGNALKQTEQIVHRVKSKLSNQDFSANYNPEIDL